MGSTNRSETQERTVYSAESKAALMAGDWKMVFPF